MQGRILTDEDRKSIIQRVYSSLTPEQIAEFDERFAREKTTETCSYNEEKNEQRGENSNGIEEHQYIRDIIREELEKNQENIRQLIHDEIEKHHQQHEEAVSQIEEDWNQKFVKNVFPPPLTFKQQATILGGFVAFSAVLFAFAQLLVYSGVNF